MNEVSFFCFEFKNKYIIEEKNIMGANCSNCNCNRDEKENELSIDGNNGASKVVLHEQSFTYDA